MRPVIRFVRSIAACLVAGALVALAALAVTRGAIPRQREKHRVGLLQLHEPFGPAVEFQETLSHFQFQLRRHVCVSAGQ